ncbi:MAG: PilZ domain-containing protein [Planctomycetes bacterium]|nr:PilZ domain-containing protein [Planctomycetota bacterium]
MTGRMDSPETSAGSPASPPQVTIYGIRRSSDRGNIPDPLKLLELSATGIVARSDQPYDAGQQMVLCMPLTLGTGKGCLPATVVRCDRDSDGFRVGLMFLKAASA